MKKIIQLMVIISFFTLSWAFAGENPYIGKKVSAYLIGAFMSVDDAKAKLTANGFEVLTTYSPVTDGTTIIFTDEALKKEGAKPKRSHAALLRMFIDEKEKMISITNPLYFGKAFMQDAFNYDVFSHELAQLNKTFSGLQNSMDALNFDDLGNYHFMVNMPYYSDIVELADAPHEELVSKAKKYKRGKLFLFELKLSNNSSIVGYDLDKRTKKFVKKIGRANASLLPYSIAIEGDKATALDAKYYLAVAYPLLSLKQFTTIATVPGAISKELAKPFK